MIVTLLFLSFAVNSFSQKCLRVIGGGSPYGEKRIIRVTELTVREYLDFVANNNFDTTLFPEFNIRNLLPSNFLFQDLLELNPKYLKKKKINNYYWITVKKQTTRLETERLKSILYMPITGISYKQATSYCNWLEVFTNEIKSPLSKCKFSITLPSEADYNSLIPNLDSMPINGEYKFNYRETKVLNNPTVEFELNSNKLVRCDRFSKDENYCYNLQGNAAEMTSTEGISMGGSYIHYAGQTLKNTNIAYTKPEIWLGFRFIATIR